jgi:hypothetical protein
LITTAQGKQQALQHLNTLVSYKLGQLQSTQNAAAAVLSTKPPAITMTAGASNSRDSNMLQGMTETKTQQSGGSSSQATESHRANVRRRRHHEHQDAVNSIRHLLQIVEEENSNSDLP